MNNALSIDLEFWWNNEFLKPYLKGTEIDTVEKNIDLLLSFLRIHDIKATFFVLGILAEKYPHIIEQICKDKHEIGYHSHSHTMLTNHTQTSFSEEIKKGSDLFSSYDIIGFRAPCFSLNNNTKWILPILQRYNFVYDSSLFPIPTPLYGVKNCPISVYRPSFEDISREDPNGPIIEFPISVLSNRCRIPISGGFYFRMSPISILNLGMKIINKTRPCNIYLHLKDLFPTPKIVTDPYAHFLSHYGVSQSIQKFEFLINNYRFNTISSVLRDLHVN